MTKSKIDPMLFTHRNKNEQIVRLRYQVLANYRVGARTGVFRPGNPNSYHQMLPGVPGTMKESVARITIRGTIYRNTGTALGGRNIIFVIIPQILCIGETNFAISRPLAIFEFSTIQYTLHTEDII